MDSQGITKYFCSVITRTRIDKELVMHFYILRKRFYRYKCWNNCALFVCMHSGSNWIWSLMLRGNTQQGKRGWITSSTERRTSQKHYALKYAIEIFMRLHTQVKHYTTLEIYREQEPECFLMLMLKTTCIALRHTDLRWYCFALCCTVKHILKHFIVLIPHILCLKTLVILTKSWKVFSPETFLCQKTQTLNIRPLEKLDIYLFGRKKSSHSLFTWNKLKA